MERTFLQTIGTPVKTEEDVTLSRVSGVFMNTNTGKVVALGVDQNRKVIVPVDIQEWSDAIIVGDPEDIIDPQEVHQLHEVLQKQMSLLKKSVFTESGEYLGKVIDFGMNTQFLTLTMLVVARPFLSIFLRDRKIISSKDIVKVKPESIIVKNLAIPVQMEKMRVGVARVT